MPNAVVTLTIEKAAGLVALNPGGTSNPFFTATIGAQCVTTPVVNKSLNPIFNATFTFHDCPLPAMVTLRAFNKIQYIDVEDPLGTATVTLFDVQPETTTKVVQLSHGGIAALAQRAPNGCGAVTIAYSIAPMPAEAAVPTVAEHSASQLSSLPSSTAAPQTSLAVVTPISVPAAHNIDGNGPASIPVASVPFKDHAGILGSVTHDSSSSLLASNPSATNPTATTARLQPIEGTTAAVMEGSDAFTPMLDAMQQQRAHLTPPNLTPARPPANSTFFIPQVAPPPSSLAAVNMSLKAAPINGYESYAVHGVKPPPPVSEEAAAAANPVLPSMSAEFYYANNTAHNAPAAPLSGAAHAQSSGSFVMLPVASAAPAAARFASLQESTSAALSFDTQMQTSSASSLYTSAAQAPTSASQTKLLVIPPNINGTPTPSFLQTSRASSREISRHPSVAQFPASSGNLITSFSADALPPPPLVGALPVAVPPLSPPLSSSTTGSLRSTPAALSPQRQSNSVAFVASPLPAETSVAAPSSTSTRAAAAHRGVAPAITATGARGAGAGAAFPYSATRCDAYASTSVASGTTSPKRRNPRSEIQLGTEAFAITSAAQIYADKQYLFEVAATGTDIEVFQRLRQVDPSLTNGFLECLDYSGRSLLHIAAWNGQLHVLQVLLCPQPAEPMIDLRSVVAAKSGNTILHAAACGGQAEVAQWLRYSHPTAGPLLLSMHNARSMTAAECAMEAGFPHVARLLMPN
ncbi:putative C2 domain/Ankyrin repeat (3 copies) [Leishmania utingensis]|uniref:C2 domain/Ankyrin repeat (3 copies) n=1 Tax=Leishmania utingensis TaxID=653362 RepID=A0AAW3B0R3_9TRYP